MFKSGGIILCNSKDHAYDLSAKMLKEHQENNREPHFQKGTERLLGIYENFLSGQFGLAISFEKKYLLDPKYYDRVSLKTPFWIDEKFINPKGEKFAVIGNLPGGFFTPFAIINPQENRKILDGNYNNGLIARARESAKIYDTFAQNKAKETISKILLNPASAKKIFSKMNGYDFEYLVAELLRENGMDVILTPKSRDGGLDVIAVDSDENGNPVLIIIDCTNRPNVKTLGPVKTRALMGVFMDEKMDNDKVSFASVITTADKMGPAALKLEERHQFLSVSAYDKLMDSISKYGTIRKNNLWIPKHWSEFM